MKKCRCGCMRGMLFKEISLRLSNVVKSWMGLPEWELNPWHTVALDSRTETLWNYVYFQLNAWFFNISRGQITCWIKNNVLSLSNELHWNPRIIYVKLLKILNCGYPCVKLGKEILRVSWNSGNPRGDPQNRSWNLDLYREHRGCVFTSSKNWDTRGTLVPTPCGKTSTSLWACSACLRNLIHSSKFKVPVRHPHRCNATPHTELWSQHPLFVQDFGLQTRATPHSIFIIVSECVWMLERDELKNSKHPAQIRNQNQKHNTWTAQTHRRWKHKTDETRQTAKLNALLKHNEEWMKHTSCKEVHNNRKTEMQMRQLKQSTCANNTETGRTKQIS